MFWIKVKDRARKSIEKASKKERKGERVGSAAPCPPHPAPIPPLTFIFLQAATSTKLVPRVLIAVYEAHLLVRESVFV